eukprot:s4047_g11.t1
MSLIPRKTSAVAGSTRFHDVGRLRPCSESVLHDGLVVVLDKLASASSARDAAQYRRVEVQQFNETRPLVFRKAVDNLSAALQLLAPDVSMGPRVDSRRVRAANNVAIKDGSGGAVLYWMSRDQRAHDNWALLKAQELPSGAVILSLQRQHHGCTNLVEDLALEKKASLLVCFCLVPKFLDATLRHFDFMLQGLAETCKDLQSLNIGSELTGQSVTEVPKFVRKLQQMGKRGGVHAVVCDTSPLRVPRSWTAGDPSRVSWRHRYESATSIA